MQFIFSTGSLWSYSLERCFSFARQSGFDGIEVMVDQRWDSRQATYLKQLSRQHHLPIAAIHCPFFANVPGWPNDHPGRLRESVKLAEAVGAAIVVHHLPARSGAIWVQMPGRFFPLPFPWNADADYPRWLEEEYEAAQAKTQVKLCIENMPAFRRLGRRWNYFRWNTPAELCRFTHLTLDTTHLGTWGLEPVETYAQLSGRVAHVHLSNYGGKEHLRPETGELRLDRLIARLAADGFQGAVSLEMHPEALDAGQSDDQVIERMGTSLAYCRQWAEG